MHEVLSWPADPARSRALGFVLFALMACDKQASDSLTAPDGSSEVAPSEESGRDGLPVAPENAGRPIFVDAPGLARMLALGEVTAISESWVVLPDDGTMNHCFAAHLHLEDIPETGAEFTSIVEGLGHQVTTTNAAITVEKPDLLIALMLIAADRGVVNSCHRHDSDPAGAWGDLLPVDPPLSNARQIASGVGGLQHATLEWDAERGVSVRVLGMIESGQAKSVAAWFAEHDYGPVEPSGDLVERDHGDGFTSFAAVHDGDDANWIVELNARAALSPFAAR